MSSSTAQDQFADYEITYTVTYTRTTTAHVPLEAAGDFGEADAELAAEDDEFWDTGDIGDIEVVSFRRTGIS